MFDKLELKEEDRLLVVGEIEIDDQKLNDLKKVEKSSKLEETEKFNKAILDLYSLDFKETVLDLIRSNLEEILFFLPLEEAYELTSKPGSEFFKKETITFKLFYEAEELFKKDQEASLLVKRRKNLSFRDKLAQHLFSDLNRKTEALLREGLDKNYRELFNKNLSEGEITEIIERLEIKEGILEKSMNGLDTDELLELVQIIYGAQFHET